LRVLRYGSCGRSVRPRRSEFACRSAADAARMLEDRSFRSRSAHPRSRFTKVRV
jgi:hypothetical protein